ncbi:MAG: hypothetical protein K2K26_04535 [Muribaculaceae bacterium]|nr:hypothetical protein [Muribaculaceae bacterium]
MHTLLLIIIILVALWLLWPVIWRLIQPAVQRYVARKTEDYIRRAAGMPPRSKQERSQKKENAETHDTRGEWFYDTGERRRRQQQRRSGREPLIPKEYAVDVEFVEIRDYSSATVIGEDNSGRQQIYHESQVSDAEYVMIKPKRS